MRNLRALWHRLAGLSRKDRRDRELDAELESHVEMHTAENMRRGMSREEARREALIKLGGVEAAKEAYREQRGAPLLETFAQDVRFGLRMLRKNAGFTAVAVLTLAIGIGANTSIFSLVYSLALRPLPVKDAENVISVYQEFRGRYSRGDYGMPSLLSYPEYANYRDGSHVFTGLAAFASVSLSVRGANAEAIPGLLASCNYFGVLGGNTTLGRAFTLGDCRAPGEGAIAVISDAFWQSHFGGDPSVLGKSLALDGQLFTIVGVAARDFSGTEMQAPAVWIPLTMAGNLLPDEFGSRDWLSLPNVSWLNVVGRLRPGISHGQAEAELAVLARQVDEGYPGRRTIVSVNSGAYWNSPEIRGKGGWVAAAISAVAALILVIACVNVMNLLLARAAARYQEVGVRLALGASRPRLVRQLLTESVLLAALGGVAGLLVARWLPRLLLAALPELPANPHVNLGPNLTIFAYAFLASLAAAVLCGLAPALHSTRLDLVSVLKDEGAPGASAGLRLRPRSVLSVAQVAGCAALLIAAGLLLRGLNRAETTSPGFVTRNVIVVSLDLANNGYNAARAAALQRTLRERLASLPGVAGVAQSSVLPCVTTYMAGVTIPGSQPNDSEQTVWGNMVSSSYFQTMGIPLVRGREFTEQEAQGGGAVPAVISAAMARRYWPGTDALGKRFLASKASYLVVGIVPDAQNVHLGQTDGPFFYGAAGPENALDAGIFVRTSGDSSAVAAEIPRLVQESDRNLIVKTTTLEQALEGTLAPPRTAAFLFSTLGLLAMILAVVGVSGMVAYAASQRTHEIGIRMALGAHPGEIARMLLRQSARLSAMGIAAGLALGAGAAQVISAASFLFGVSSLDPATFGGVAALLAVVELAASYFPARRAARMDPLAALRHE